MGFMKALFALPLLAAFAICSPILTLNLGQSNCNGISRQVWNQTRDAQCSENISELGLVYVFTRH
jgi:hypothetical protein